MKKFLVAVLVIAMVSMMGLVAFAYPTNTDDWQIKVTVNAEGGIDLTYAPQGISAVAWTELAIYESKPDFTDKDMDTAGVGPYSLPLRILRPNGENDACAAARTIAKGDTKVEAKSNAYDNCYPFEEGKTYYVVMCAYDGAGNWVWNPNPVKFTYSTKGEAPAPTADVSTIAFAVASVLGCGALAVRKKR